jgi:hypothetical protein
MIISDPLQLPIESAREYKAGDIEIRGTEKFLQQL